jgi:hypothetical protein
MPIDKARLMPSALVIRPFAPLTMNLNLFPEAPGRFWETEMRRIDEIMVQKMNSFMAIGDGIDAEITPMLQVGGPRALSIKTAETLGAKRQGSVRQVASALHPVSK